MATYNEEQIEQMLRRLSSRVKLGTDRVGCPTEERLAEYLNGGLDGRLRDDIDQHLISCSSCTSEIVAVNRALNESDAVLVPRWLMERAMGLIKPAATGRVVDLVVKLVRDTVELVSSAGEWMVPLTPQPVFARGKTAPSASSILQVERDLDGHRIGVEVEQVESGVCQVVVSVAAADGAPEDGVRLTLLVGEREQASYLTRQGQAVFDRIARGNYDLAISKGTASLGTIKLRIEAES
jgi:hypothetical protein